jgi:enoyl-[acyl-carrier protein] reductase/trans-2-enoyl-CoA reductase (NAD+)
MKRHGLHEGCIEQIQRLFSDYLSASLPGAPDPKGRIRIDDWEMRPEIQAAVENAWNEVTTETLRSVADFDGYQSEFLRLFGFGLPGIDYEAETDPVRACSAGS